MDSLLSNVKILESKRATITVDTDLINTYFLVANEYYAQENASEEKKYTSKALDLVTLKLRQPGMPGVLKTNLLSKQAKGYGNMGNFYNQRGDYSKALEFHFKALKIDESLHNTQGMWRHYYNISLTYDDLGEHKKALGYSFKALTYANTLSSSYGRTLIYGNIALQYMSLDSNEIALKYSDKALEMFLEQKDTVGMIGTFANMGIAYTNLVNIKLEHGTDPKNIPEYYTAVAYYKKALDLSGISGDKQGKIIELGNLGSLYLTMKKYEDAKVVLFQSLALSEELQDLYGIMEVNGHLESLYDSLRDYKQALKYYKNYIAAKDSLFNIENAKKNVETEMNFEFEKKENAQKAEHEKTVIALEAENQIQRNTRNFVVVLAIMALLLVASGFVYFNNRKALRVRELHSQQLLLSQEKERQRISKELHDSIGQNILFIKNQMIKNNDLRLMSSVDETLEEVRTISKDLYPNQLEKYGLVAAVDALAEKVKESSGIFVSYDLDVIENNLSPDKQINYYRIIQECITNTLKHAEASALRITATQVNDHLELVIQDNGKGFDKGILSKKSQRSFGLLNLEERVKYLKGKLILETSAGKGTKYIFSIPS